MIIKSKVFVNVFSSSAQVIFTGLVYFFLYRILLIKLNVELLGVWSIVLSTSSLANLANFGVSSSVTRFVSFFSKNGENEKIEELIFTSAVFLFVFFSLLAILIFPFAEMILNGVIKAKYLSEAIAILPYSIACLIINAITGVYSSVLEGIQRNYIKNILLSLSSLVLLGFVYALTSTSMGLKGVAIAQVIQSIFSLVASIVFVIKLHPHNPFKWRWSKSIFKEIFSYGTKFQLISISTMLNDPLTKILLAKFGGLQFAGYYEMANRLAMQFRGVLVSGNQSLLPVIVSIEDQKEKAQKFYKGTFDTIFVTSIITFVSIFLTSASISIIWIGQNEFIFTTSLELLCLGYFFNVISGPAYFTEMSYGKLNLILMNHMFLCVCNAFFGTLLGFYFGGTGVVIGWVIGLILASFYLMIRHHQIQKIDISLFGNRMIRLSLLTTCGLVLVHFIIYLFVPTMDLLFVIGIDVILIALFYIPVLSFLSKTFKK